MDWYIPLVSCSRMSIWSFFFQAEDGIRDDLVTGVQTCALPISGLVHALIARRVYKTWQVPSPTWPRNRFNQMRFPTAISMLLPLSSTNGLAAFAPFKGHFLRLLSSTQWLLPHH